MSSGRMPSILLVLTVKPSCVEWVRFTNSTIYRGERRKLIMEAKKHFFLSNINSFNTFFRGPRSWFLSQPLLWLHLTMQTANPVDQRPACTLQTPSLPACLISQCWLQYTVQHYRVCFPWKPWGLRILLFQCCLFSWGYGLGQKWWGSICTSPLFFSSLQGFRYALFLNMDNRITLYQIVAIWIFLLAF